MNIMVLFGISSDVRKPHSAEGGFDAKHQTFRVRRTSLLEAERSIGKGDIDKARDIYEKIKKVYGKLELGRRESYMRDVLRIFKKLNKY